MSSAKTFTWYSQSSWVQWAGLEIVCEGSWHGKVEQRNSHGHTGAGSGMTFRSSHSRISRPILIDYSGAIHFYLLVVLV